MLDHSKGQKERFDEQDIKQQLEIINIRNTALKIEIEVNKLKQQTQQELRKNLFEPIKT